MILIYMMEKSLHFLKKQITHEEWVQIKKKTHIWNDKYIDIPCDTISRLYKAKGDVIIYK
jgi:hypothetical protein